MSDMHDSDFYKELKRTEHRLANSIAVNWCLLIIILVILTIDNIGEMARGYAIEDRFSQIEKKLDQIRGDRAP